MDGSIFYYAGGVLVIAALVLSFIGIRGKDSFPPSGRALAGISVLFGLLVIATAAYAVANAREEQDHRNKELAEEEAHAAAEEPPPPPPGGGAPGGGAPPPPAAGGSAQTLDLTSPDDGGLEFEPSGLSADAGTVTLAYANPSPIPHNINIEDDAGVTLKESEDITAGEVDLTLQLVPGEYIFYCSIQGHRESGMEGTLTVE